jgi:hypothetical protein
MRRAHQMLRMSGPVILGVLAACPMAHATRTVSWFLAHPDVREQVHKLCMNDPGEAQHTPDCLNAATAVEQADINRVGSQIPVKSLAQICAEMPPYQRPFNHCGDGR